MVACDLCAGEHVVVFTCFRCSFAGRARRVGQCCLWPPKEWLCVECGEEDAEREGKKHKPPAHVTNKRKEFMRQWLA
jgi:hypothetical protein